MSTASSNGFVPQHVGITSDGDLSRALARVGQPSLDALVDTAVPPSIRTDALLDLPAPATGQQVLAELRDLASRNRPMRQMIGQGFSATVTPAVIRRNILENPAWYTAYTPYQPEISQGRLEALITFQTMVADLTALPVANASLLDESSAAAEAMLLMRRANRAHRDAPVLVDTDVFPQTLAVLRGRALAADIELVLADLSTGLPEGDFSGVILQQPGDSGRVADWAGVVAAAHERGALVTVVADILSLALITPPGEIGADIAVGSTQRFGVPLFFGGPHSAYMAVTTALTRQIPGRLVGISHDDAGTPALRLTLQTREQHIRRERATSNICTAQALLAIVAGMYAVHHGPDGIRAIAERT
ncbi:MAG: glycine dehydrogenase, partial [Pauljensenia sp.]